VKIAAYQAPLLPAGSLAAVDLIRTQVKRCESEHVAVLCCPEAILGGLADYAADPTQFALTADRLDSTLAPLANNTVTTIIGFTEFAEGDRLYNSAAVFHRGSTIGVYRKLHPAINRSIYEPGRGIPIFEVENLNFGIVICNDSNFPKLASALAARGAIALFVPTNNGLPVQRSSPDLIAESRRVDIAAALENHMWVIRADVVGSNGELKSYGSSGIVDPTGRVVRSSRQLSEDLLVVEMSASTTVATASHTSA
jgi:predicted amidohydrolase